MADFGETHVIALADHQRDEKAVQVIGVGKGEERLASERLEAAARVGGAVVEQGGRGYELRASRQAAG